MSTVQLRNFNPTSDWKRVYADEVLPPGCEIRLSVGGGYPEARLRPVKPWPAKKPSRWTVLPLWWWAALTALLAIVVVFWLFRLVTVPL